MDDLIESDFDITATATENGSTVSYAKKLVLRDDAKTVDIVDYIGTNTVNKVSYKFPKSLLYDKPPFGYVDVIDFNGVETRIQIHDGKAMYSYEIQNGSPKFEEIDGCSSLTSKFLGSITLYGATGSSNNSKAGGTQTIYDGTPMSYYSHSNKHFWNMGIADSSERKGYYMVSGWIKSNDTSLVSKKLYLGKGENFCNEFTVYFEPNGEWQYFSIMSYIEANTVYLRMDALEDVSIRDVRLTFQGTGILADDNTSHAIMADYVLLNGSDAISFRNVRFHDKSQNGFTLNETENQVVTFSDVLNFLFRQLKHGATDEIYYNNRQDVITGAEGLWVSYIDQDESDGEENTPPPRYSICNYDLGVRAYVNDKVSLTKYHAYENTGDDGTVQRYIDKISMIDGTVISKDTLDANLDVIMHRSDGITTNYVRDAQGRITEESVAGLYKRKTTYTNATVTTEELDPTTGATINSVKYFLYSTWGTVYKIEVRDANGVLQTRTKDTHDDAKSILLKKEFGTGLARANNLSYAKGALASFDDGALQYHYSYNATGDLESVIGKDDAGIEHHAYSRANGETTVESKYPTEDGALHTEKQIFDKYGRLASIEGVLENTYSLDPYWYYFISETDHEKTMDQYDRDEHGELSHACAKVNGAAVDCKDAVLSQISDKLTGENTQYGYHNGLLTAAVTRNASNTLLRQETYVYDALGRLKKNHFDYDIANSHYVTSNIVYRYTTSDPFANNQVDEYTYKINGVTKALTHSDYDSFNRLECKKYNFSGKWFERTFTYDKTQISQETHGNSVTSYQYDDLGRIIGINGNNTPISYVYDTYGQLTRENNKVLDKTFVYEYNNNGGISNVEEYAYTEGTLAGTPVTTAFTYDSAHPDRLIKVGSTSIGYNAMGCPTTVNGYTATWTRGKLSKLTKGSRITGTHTYNYTYNALGQRIGINYNYMAGTSPSSALVMGMLTSYSHKFCYDQSGRLICENKTSQYYGEGSATERIVYLYDESGIIGLVHTSESGTTATYYLQRNLLGDVIAIYDTNGTKVGGYAYDAWGNCTITLNTNGVAIRNPIRYRGYYYDQDTGLYFLNARYYSPAWRRFISPDDTGYLDPESINGLNLYTYCNNDPVNYCDPSGHFWDWVFDAVFIAWGIFDIVNGGYKDWKNWVALGIDIAFAVLPFVPSGLGQVIRVGNRIDNAADVVSAINKVDNIKNIPKVTMIGRNMARVIDVAQGIGKADELYKIWKGYDATATGLMRLFHDGISIADNAFWMWRKLRSGYTVIDIGMQTIHRSWGGWYGAERLVIALWKTRNVWKLPINYFS